MNYVHGYDRKIILLFKMSVTYDCAAFQRRCHSESLASSLAAYFFS